MLKIIKIRLTSWPSLPQTIITAAVHETQLKFRREQIYHCYIIYYLSLDHINLSAYLVFAPITPFRVNNKQRVTHVLL